MRENARVEAAEAKHNRVSMADRFQYFWTSLRTNSAGMCVFVLAQEQFDDAPSQARLLACETRLTNSMLTSIQCSGQMGRSKSHRKYLCPDAQHVTRPLGSADERSFVGGSARSEERRV